MAVDPFTFPVLSIPLKWFAGWAAGRILDCSEEYVRANIRHPFRFLKRDMMIRRRLRAMLECQHFELAHAFRNFNTSLITSQMALANERIDTPKYQLDLAKYRNDFLKGVTDALLKICSSEIPGSCTVIVWHNYRLESLIEDIHEYCNNKNLDHSELAIQSGGITGDEFSIGTEAYNKAKDSTNILKLENRSTDYKNRSNLSPYWFLQKCTAFKEVNEKKLNVYVLQGDMKKHVEGGKVPATERYIDPIRYETRITYYRSVCVLPIRIFEFRPVSDSASDEKYLSGRTGFLWVDSSKPNAFDGVAATCADGDREYSPLLQTLHSACDLLAAARLLFDEAWEFGLVPREVSSTANPVPSPTLLNPNGTPVKPHNSQSFASKPVDTK